MSDFDLPWCGSRCGLRGPDGLVSVVTRLCGGKSKRSHGLIPRKARKILTFSGIHPAFYIFRRQSGHFSGASRLPLTFSQCPDLPHSLKCFHGVHRVTLALAKMRTNGWLLLTQ